MFEYKCIAGPTTIAITTDSEQNTAALRFEEIINKEARGGWEFVCMDEYRTSKPPGCFGGSQPEISLLKLLIFKRQISELSAA